MSNLYQDFEKRFTDSWFSAGWVEVEPKKQESNVARKDLNTLEIELQEINQELENISQKQLRLANLAKLYNNSEA